MCTFKVCKPGELYSSRIFVCVCVHPCDPHPDGGTELSPTPQRFPLVPPQSFRSSSPGGALTAVAWMGLACSCSTSSVCFWLSVQHVDVRIHPCHGQQCCLLDYAAVHTLVIHSPVGDLHLSCHLLVIKSSASRNTLDPALLGVCLPWAPFSGFHPGENLAPAAFLLHLSAQCL